ncbi:MAG: PAS domain-containing protein [Rhizobiaceae bacterium]|nr:PAS domain-containing protein [Rhizobiaceae bacterium]
MKSRPSLALFAYWNRLRGAAAAPRRTSIEPGDLRDILTETFILHAQGTQDEFTFRLVGTAVSALFGRELRETALRDLVPVANRALLGRMLRNCVQDDAVIVAEFAATSVNRREATLELLLLPLASEQDGPRILGCLSPVKPEFWFGLEPVAQLSLASIRILDPSREPMFLANRPAVDVPTLAPDASALRPLAPKSRHLRVIKGGRDN